MDNTTTTSTSPTSSNTKCYLDEASNKMVFPEGFCPGIHHVICGRGKRSYGHFGNKNFATETVASYMEDYSFAKTKLEKSAIVQAIVNQVEANGGFIRYDTQLRRYVRAEDNIGREKTSQSLRDCLKNKYKSSKDIKRENRIKKRIGEDTEDDATEDDATARRPSEVKSAPTNTKALGLCDLMGMDMCMPSSIVQLQAFIHRLRMVEALARMPPRSVSVTATDQHDEISAITSPEPAADFDPIGFLTSEEAVMGDTASILLEGFDPFNFLL
jgi:hypothetical protein